MGRTRKRSRHGEGRKPFYKEHRLHLLPDNHGAVSLNDSANMILAHLPFGEPGWQFNTRTHWREIDLSRLRILCEAGSDIDRSADALARAPKTLVYKASGLGLKMPVEWRRLIRPAYSPHPQPQVVLQYPYIVRSRPEHADLMRANALVPRGLPNHVRADICQNIMVALFEGTVTLGELAANRSRMRYFIAKFYHDQRPYAEVHGNRIDDERDYYDVASRDAVGEWRDQEMNERRRAYDTLETFSSPTQLHDVYNQEIATTTSISHTRGNYLSRQEVRDLLENDEWTDHVGTYATRSPLKHALNRARERFGIQLTYNDLKKLTIFCATHKPTRSDEMRDVHRVRFMGQSIRVVIDGRTGHVITILPKDAPEEATA